MRIKLAKKQGTVKEENLYAQQYASWRNNMKKEEFESKFFLLYKDFEVHLKDIPPGPLKLYLFYGFHAKNDTGVLWYGIEKISQYFNVSEKTINNWNSELIERGLIARITTGNRRNKTTYLLPFSMNLTTLPDIEVLKQQSFNSVYGEQFKAFHLFQWRKSLKKDEYDSPYHSLILVCLKKFPTADYNHITAFKIPTNIDFENKVIDTPGITSDIYTFKSDIEVPEIQVDIQGVAVNSKYNLKQDHILYSLLKELTDPETDFSQYGQVQLIEKEVRNDEV